MRQPACLAAAGMLCGLSALAFANVPVGAPIENISLPALAGAAFSTVVDFFVSSVVCVSLAFASSSLAAAAFPPSLWGEEEESHLLGSRLHVVERGDFPVLAPHRKFGVVDFRDLGVKQREPGIGFHIHLRFRHRLDQQLQIFKRNGRVSRCDRCEGGLLVGGRRPVRAGRVQRGD